MEKKVEEMAAKIYVERFHYNECPIHASEIKELCVDEDLVECGMVEGGGIAAKIRLAKQVEISIAAAKVFHGICGKDVVRVSK